MKKYLKIISVSFFAIIFCIGLNLTFCGKFNQNKSFAAEEEALPSYFSAMIYKKNIDNTLSEVGNQLIQNQTVLLDSNQILKITLGDPGFNNQYAISSFPTIITVDGQTKPNKADYIKENTQVPALTDVNYIDINLDLYSADADSQGMYTIYFSYMEYFGNQYSVSTRKSFSFTFFLFKTSTYMTASLPSISVSNVETTLAGSSAQYARTHQFHYTNTITSSRLNLPTYVFDCSRFELKVTKSTYSISEETYISLDSNGTLTQTNPIVKIYHDTDLNQAIVTFNDIGNYKIEFIFIHYADGQKYFLSDLTSQSKFDRLNIFGIQLYHTDINSTESDNKKEFKLFNSQNLLVAGKQTDITFSGFDDTYITGSTEYTISDMPSNSDISFQQDKLNLIPSTNQAPVELVYNASIIKNKSCYYTYNQNTDKWTKHSDYVGTAFSEVGIYLVKVTYTSTNAMDSSKQYTQWFLFRIDNNTPSFTVRDQNGNDLTSNSWTNGAVDVLINNNDNPFNSEVKLEVYSKDFGQTLYSSPVVVTSAGATFDQNKNYKVVISFGKNLKKQTISYFSIDTTPITGITARVISNSAGGYTKITSADFFSNEDIVIEWNEKSDNSNITKAYYKYIPMTKTQTNWTTPLLESYYSQGKYIPVDYCLNTTNDLVRLEYENNVYNTFVEAENILTENGMYIFYIEDLAGNFAYQAFVIDKTSPVILQKITESGIYVTDFTSLNITADNSTILWGKYKVIKFDINTQKFNTTTWTPNAQTTTIDPWLQVILSQYATYNDMLDEDCNFKIITADSQDNLYLASKIDTQNVKIQINGITYGIADSSINGGHLIDNFSYQIDVVSNEVLYEDTYTFFVSDESNVTDTHQSAYSLQISTDISKTAVRFEENQTYNNLEKHLYEISDAETSTKTMHYYPINLNSTQYSNQCLELQYITSPTQNTIELESIILEFYPYVSDYLVYSPDNATLSSDQKKVAITKNEYYTSNETLQYIGLTDSTKGLTQYEYYTLEELFEKEVLNQKSFVKGTSFVLAKTPLTTTVYDYLSTNLGTLDDNLYIYQINKIYDSQNDKYYTQEGKYIITRTYRNFGSETTNLVGSKYDFMTRKLVLFVDRQGIISSPESFTIDNKSELISRIGNEIYLEVLSGSDNSKQFKHIYRASNFSDDSITYLLETNMLPVKLYLPLYKFGQIIQENYLVPNSLLFFDENAESYIDSNQLQVTISNLSTGETITSSVSYTLVNEKPTNSQTYTLYGNKYMVWEGLENNNKMVVNLDTFSSVGEWKIQISQKNTNLKGYKPVLSFYVNIKSETPDFELLDSTATNLNFYQNYYWTNDNKIRVQWTDSSNDYMAKIDQTDIQCYANGNLLYKPTADKIITASNGKTHYFDLDISNLSHNTVVMITMHYQGTQDYYPQNTWSITKQIKIDKIAPTESIEKMIAFANEPSLLNTVSLRDGHGQTTKYNKSSDQGLFKNFAFAVDKNRFEELIWSSTDKKSVYYRQISNKYSDNTITEFDPQASDALSRLVYGGQYTMMINIDAISYWKANTYYEIVEVDFAQNITVYTIYFSYIDKINKNQANFNIVEYKDDISSYYVYAEDLSQENYSVILTAKDTFTLKNLNAYDYAWSILTFGTQKYIFSPYDLAENEVYKYNLNQSSKVLLEQEFCLTPSNANYLFSLSNTPCQNITLAVTVTDKELEITHPTRDTAYFEITSQQITSTTTLDWQYIQVWEYINNKPNKSAKYENGKVEPIEISNPESFDIAVITQNSNKTLFEIKTPYSGAQYRYKITDNFGTVYVFQHLYGQEYVEQIENHDGLANILTFDFDDEETYLSKNNITYNYYYGTTNVTVQIIEYNVDGSFKTNISYTIDPTIPNSYGGYLDVETHNSYASITMKAVDNSTANNGYFGGTRLFVITSKTAIETNDDPTKNTYETDTKNFMIYNLVPQLNLKGKNRQNLNGLFGSGDNMTSAPVTVEFEDTSNMLFPCKIQIVCPDGSSRQISSGETFSDVGEYKIILSWTGIMDAYKSTDSYFKISPDAWQYYAVEVLDENGVYVAIETTGTPYSTTGNISYNNHYIVNTTNYKIRTNQTQLIKCSTPTTDEKSGITTYIYEISNYGEEQEFLNYFKTTIAITVIPQSNKLVSDFYYIDTEGNRVNFEYSQASYIITKEFENSNYVILAWNPYYKIEENKITAEILYGENNQRITYENISSESNIYQIKLSRSGAYSIRFTDLAGNINLFDYNSQIENSTSNFEFIFLNNVVFTVNDESPIQYAIYNSDVEIKIPQYTIGYYDSNANPSIVVLRNGVEYTNFATSASERKWTFTDSGLYQITWNAKKDGKEIRQEKYYFQIIRANELVWAFNIESYEGYYIKQILKNNTDVTEKFTTQKLGELKLVETTQNGIQTQKYYLTDLFISLYDELTGSGNYTVTIATDNELQQEFTYSFRVNNANPPINISLEEGNATTDEITVTFNAYNLYEEVGDCIVRISGNKDLIFNAEYFEKADSQELYEIKLTSAREYFIQILTPSDRLLFTYKVTRNQPLNTIAIILIVVSSIVVAAGIVVFILLRKRMKIR